MTYFGSHGKKLKGLPHYGSKKAIPLSLDQVTHIIKYFESIQDYRMVVLCHLLFRCIRIGDCLNTLRKKHIYNPINGDVRENITFYEEKRGNLREVPIQGKGFIASLLKYYKSHIQHLNKDNPLFYNKKCGKILGSSGVRRILSQFVGKQGIEQCSPYSFRKAGGRVMYKNNVLLTDISTVFGHCDPLVTMRYIGITPEDIKKAMEILGI